MMPAPDPDNQQSVKLEAHLAERIGDVRDGADFSASRRARAQGSAEAETAGSEIVIEGAEHLGGRKVQDKFTRTGRQSVVAQPVPDNPKKLEHHLKARLGEVADERIISSSNDPLKAYQELRRKLGGK